MPINDFEEYKVFLLLEKSLNKMLLSIHFQNILTKKGAYVLATILFNMCIDWDTIS